MDVDDLKRIMAEITEAKNEVNNVKEGSYSYYKAKERLDEAWRDYTLARIWIKRCVGDLDESG